jgi:nitrous oxidase accessory protein NosD
MLRRTSRLAISTALVAAALSAALAPPATAVPRSCHVANLTAGTSTVGAGENLQRAIDAADPGSTLRVTGRCKGSFTIDKRLTLRGRSTDRFPRPTLDAGGDGRALFVLPRTVTVGFLWIVGGAVRSGGGIYNDGGNLTLMGTTVTGNSARTSGGGIVNDRGRLTLNGGTVAGNAAGTVAGGIFNYRGVLTMNGGARVRNNTAGRHGGGIYNYGTLTMNDSSSVIGNDAGRDGGGIYDIGSITLNDTAAVTGNTATTAGGGILLVQGHVHVCSIDVAISPNTPDDPPATTSCP